MVSRAGGRWPGPCRSCALAVPRGRTNREGEEETARVPGTAPPAVLATAAGPGVEGRCFHRDALSLPRSLLHPARPRSLPSVPPSGSSLPPALPPSRPPQPPPAGTCVSSAISPFVRVSQCRSPLARAPSPGASATPFLGSAGPGPSPSPPRSPQRSPHPPTRFIRGAAVSPGICISPSNLAIGGATCGRALRLARPDQPAPAPR